jgi:spore maturation protein CgeB
VLGGSDRVRGSDAATIDCLFVGLFFDYGRPEADVSHEFLNLFTGLVEHPRLAVRPFFVDVEAGLHGPEGMRERFSDLVLLKPPTILIHHAFTPKLDPPLEAVSDLTRRGVATVEWDADSSWRFEEFVRPRIGSYALFVTTHPASVPLYRAAGADVHLSQWAVSSRYRGYEPAGERVVDVSFVGQAHGNRAAVIAGLRKAGIPVETWGRYWPRRRFSRTRHDHGYVPYRDAIAAMGQSVVSLNLSNASVGRGGSQIKGRHFEIPAVGACQLTTPTDGLEAWFEPGKEVVVAEAGELFVDALRSLLNDRERTRAIAEAGFRRTWAEHTWEKRIDGILGAVGLS